MSKVVKVRNLKGNVIGEREIPKPYMVHDDKGGEIFEDFYETEELCNSIALKEWCGMSDYDKKQRNEYYTAEIGEVDEEGFPMAWKVLNKIV